LQGLVKPIFVFRTLKGRCYAWQPTLESKFGKIGLHTYIRRTGIPNWDKISQRRWMH